MIAKAAVPDPCNLPGADLVAGCGVKNKVDEAVDKTADKVSSAIEFGKDPFGWIAQKEAEAAKDLTETVIPALTRLTQPDLSQEWFLDAYKISFAAAIFGWVLILLWDLATFRRRGESGQEVADSFVKWTPVFIGGSMFGPAVGMFLVGGVGALNAALADWGLSATSDEVVSQFNKLISDDPEKFLGGSFMAMLIFGALVLALLLVFLVLIIMLVTLYLSGVALPLSLMWATKVGQREKGRKIIMVWAGVLCSQPLIFLLLGFAFSGAAASMMDVLERGSASDPREGGLQNLVQLLFIIIMLVIATLGPTSLAAYAPVGPTDSAPAGPRVNAGSGTPSGAPSGARGGAGSPSPSDSQTAQIAQRNAAQQASTSTAAGTGAGTAAAAAATGGTLLAAKAAHDTGKGVADAAKGAQEQAQDVAEGAQGGGSDGGLAAEVSDDAKSGSGSSPAAGGIGSEASGESSSQHDSGEQGGLAGQVSENAGGSSRQSDDNEQGGLAAQVSENAGGSGQQSDDNQPGALAATAREGGGSAGQRLRGDGGGSLSLAGMRNLGKKTANATRKGASLAQQAGDLAEMQMDHHRDGARGRR